MTYYNIHYANISYRCYLNRDVYEIRNNIINTNIVLQLNYRFC